MCKHIYIYIYICKRSEPLLKWLRATLIRRPRESPQHLLVVLQSKLQSPQISANSPHFSTTSVQKNDESWLAESPSPERPDFATPCTEGKS